MTDDKPYKCVNCGEPAAALFKTYGPSVLKLTKCDKCKGIVDKYIEYDPVIVMIDLVLLSKEAQRHVLYNTEFKSYWKLLIILIMLETYGVWRCDSLFNIVVDSLCNIGNTTTVNTTIFNAAASLGGWRAACAAWARDEVADDADLFIWEKDFYIKFMAIFTGIVAYVLSTRGCMRLLKPFITQNEVSWSRLLKAVSLGQAGVVLALPALVWGAPDDAARAPHYSLVLLYGAALAASLGPVLYECPVSATVLVLIISNIAKYSATFYVTPYLKTFVT